MRIQCDRCEQLVVGCIIGSEYGEIMTGGFYLADYWPEYRRGGEEIICDECMLNDPKFAEHHLPHNIR